MATTLEDFINGSLGSKAAHFNHVQQTLGTELNHFFNGVIFKGNYTIEEQKQILIDLKEEIARQERLSPIQSTTPKYFATAGAPGSGKTTFFENKYGLHSEVEALLSPPLTWANRIPYIGWLIDSFLAFIQTWFTSSPSQAGIYADPDRVGLPALSGYRAEVARANAKPDLRNEIMAAAYAKWRDASNFIANYLIVYGLAMGHDVFHGTTSQNLKFNQKAYAGMEKLGIHRHIDFIFATPEQRAAALTKRAGAGNIQVSSEDAKGKGAEVLRRLGDLLLPHDEGASASTISFSEQTGAFHEGEGKLSPVSFFDGRNLTHSIRPLIEKHAALDGLSTCESTRIQAVAKTHEQQKTPAKPVLSTSKPTSSCCASMQLKPQSPKSPKLKQD